MHRNSVCVSIHPSVCLLPQNLPLIIIVYTRYHRVLLSCFLDFCRVAFAKNESYGIICWSLPHSSFPYELSIDKLCQNYVLYQLHTLILIPNMYMSYLNDVNFPFLTEFIYV